MKFKYQVITPYIKDGKFVDGHTNEQEKGLFGQKKLFINLYLFLKKLG